MSRSIKKGPFVAYVLLKKVDNLNDSGSKDIVKTWSPRVYNFTFYGRTYNCSL